MTTSDLRLDPAIQELFAETSAEVYQSAAPVSEWPIVAWCRALQDRNPVYQDDDAARRFGHGGILAPPVMMHSFTMPGILGTPTDGLLARLRGTLAQHGLNSVLAANYEQEFLAPMRLGDRLTRTMRLASLGEEKVTGAGIGRFVVMEEKIVNQRGEHVGNQSLRILFFRPADHVEQPAGRPPREAAPASEVSEKRVTLPALSIPLTTTMIVAAALASNDYEAIHHDRDAALAQRLKDIVMNVLTSTGLAMRYVTDWAGPAAKVRRISTRLKGPNYPGDTMTLTGSADAPYGEGPSTEVRVLGANARGPHIESVVTIE
jgi:acyl dehydratase